MINYPYKNKHFYIGIVRFLHVLILISFYVVDFSSLEKERMNRYLPNVITLSEPSSQMESRDPLFIAFMQGMLKQVQHDGNRFVQSEKQNPKGSAYPTNRVYELNGANP